MHSAVAATGTAVTAAETAEVSLAAVAAVVAVAAVAVLAGKEAAVSVTPAIAEGSAFVVAAGLRRGARVNAN